MIALHQGGFPHSYDHGTPLTPNPHIAIKTTATNNVAAEFKIQDVKVCLNGDGVMDEGREENRMINKAEPTAVETSVYVHSMV